MDFYSNIDLPVPFTSDLDNVTVQLYRLQYQKFRLGHAEGAKGEAVKAFDESLLGAEDDDNDIIDSREALYNIINLHRGQYRRYREGNPFGSKGEISDLSSKIEVRHVKLLPVAQLASLISAKKLAKGRVAGPKGDHMHVHLGAGRLGLGLVIKAIEESGVPFAILSHASDTWSPCIQASATDSSGGNFGRLVDIVVNGEPAVQGLSVVTNAQELVEVTAAYAEAAKSSQPRKMRLFVITNDEDVKAAVARVCGTWSCALGPGILSAVPPLIKLRTQGATADGASPPPSALQCYESLKGALSGSIAGDVPAPWPQPAKPVSIYCCENDHGAVDKLGEMVADTDADVVCCMVDRICSGRDVSSAKVEIKAEPYTGNVVVLAPPQRALDYAPPPMAGPGVVVAKVKSEAEYFCRRKLLVVNGMHTTLAFYTLCTKQPFLPTPPTPPGTAPSLRRQKSVLSTVPENHDLMTLKDHTEERKKEIWAWAVARLLIVLYEHDEDVIKHAHGLGTDDDDDDDALKSGSGGGGGAASSASASASADEEVCRILIEYARTTLGRFDTVPDTTGRVLGGGVATRYQGRLKSTEEFLQTFKAKNSSKLAQKLLKAAGVTEAFMKQTVSHLVDDALRFTGLKVDKTPKYI